MELASGCTSSFEKLPNFKNAGRAALDACGIAGISCWFLRFSPWGAPVRSAIIAGIVTALAATLIGTALLAFGLRSSWKRFWLAFAGGMAVRMTALAGLAVFSAAYPGVYTGALLGSYALAVSGFLLIEYRRLIERITWISKRY